ncbi:L-arabinose isomerase [Erwinia amylovora Ea644]|nr:L-arabinose isomerase [Erwinia amylovora Ea644]CCP07174.1 L-arabinose isomerase [Erwinia amylovora MR1]
MQGIEVVVIDDQTTPHGLRDALRWNEAYYRLNQR